MICLGVSKEMFLSVFWELFKARFTDLMVIVRLQIRFLLATTFGLLSANGEKWAPEQQQYTQCDINKALLSLNSTQIH